MADKIKNIKGSLILLLAAFIWGTAFVAQTSGADSVGTFTFNTCRSVVGALFFTAGDSAFGQLRKTYLRRGKRHTTGAVFTDKVAGKGRRTLRHNFICGNVLTAVWNRYLSGRCGGIRQGRLSYGNVCGAGCHLFRMDGQKAASADCGIHCRLYCRNVSFVYVRRICRDLYGRCVRIFVCSRFYVSYSYS